MKKNKTYLAYGSNLNLEQMARRCPTAKVIGAAQLEGYALAFRGNGGAVADVEPRKSGRVPVLLWEITPSDEAALDLYEGYPRLYIKKTLAVDFKGKPMKAMAYVMAECLPPGRPRGEYLNTILEGYISAGFDRKILMDAVKASAPKARRIKKENTRKEGDCENENNR
jgi:hypothetical protein